MTKSTDNLGMTTGFYIVNIIHTELITRKNGKRVLKYLISINGEQEMILDSITISKYYVNGSLDARYPNSLEVPKILGVNKMTTKEKQYKGRTITIVKDMEHRRIGMFLVASKIANCNRIALNLYKPFFEDGKSYNEYVNRLPINEIDRLIKKKCFA